MVEREEILEAADKEIQHTKNIAMETEQKMMDDFERDEAERRKFLESSRRLKKVDRFLTQSGMRKEQVRGQETQSFEVAYL